MLALPLVVAQGSFISLPSLSPSPSSSYASDHDFLNYRVLDCQPFLQGLIVETTEIIIQPPKERPPLNTVTKQEIQVQQSEKFYVSSLHLGIRM